MFCVSNLHLYSTNFNNCYILLIFSIVFNIELSTSLFSNKRSTKKCLTYSKNFLLLFPELLCEIEGIKSNFSNIIKRFSSLHFAVRQLSSLSYFIVPAVAMVTECPLQPPPPGSSLKRPTCNKSRFSLSLKSKPTSYS